MARLFACVLLLAAAIPVVAQPPAGPAVPAPGPVPIPPPPPPTPPPDEELTARPGEVGYIDTAAPMNQVRLRADFGYDFRTPNRAEFFYARSNPPGPGLPRAERSIDFQDQTLYIEKTLAADWSIFVEGGLRSINPEVNANATGFGDMNLGFKYAFLNDSRETWTFQFRSYLPTGAASRGLGTDHVSLEPAILGFVHLSDDLGLATELRYWQPIGGTDFSAPVVRYGLGLRYDAWACGDVRVAPIVEAIGWTVLGGNESRLMPNGTSGILDSGGTTVVNLKLGARLDLSDRAGFYAGYGRAVTGERWYRDVVRVEFRWLY
jgi:hypothetical protein